jgi:hypothetical protein
VRVENLLLIAIDERLKNTFDMRADRRRVSRAIFVRRRWD